jgi:hypothetical protein
MKLFLPFSGEQDVQQMSSTVPTQKKPIMHIIYSPPCRSSGQKLSTFARITLFVATALLSSSKLPAAPEQCRGVQIVDPGDLGGGATTPPGINHAGQVVGYSKNTSGIQLLWRSNCISLPQWANERPQHIAPDKLGMVSNSGHWHK